MGKVSNKSIDISGGKRLSLHLQAFHGNKWAHNGLALSKSLISPAGKHKRPAEECDPQGVPPWAARHCERLISQLSNDSVWCLSIYQRARFTSLRLTRTPTSLPVPWTSPFVVNRPKSSLRRKSALPVVRIDIIAQWSGLYKKRHARVFVRDMEALKWGLFWQEEPLEVDLIWKEEAKFLLRKIHL